MKKFMNDPMNFVNDMMSGIMLAHGDLYKLAANDRKCLVRKETPIEGKVAIVTGGGSGHLPVFLGYVGEGLADGCAVGNVFSSPTARQIYKVAKAVSADKGVLFLYGMYQGDMMNFDKAADMAREDGLTVESLRVSDDVASAPADRWQERRGVGGIFFAYKIAGAIAKTGASLDEVIEVTKRAITNIRTLGVAISSCILPAMGKETFEIEADKMEIGMGIHGESGVERVTMKSSKEIASILVDTVCEDAGLKAGEEVAVLVNSLGGTPLEELYILYGDIYPLLEARGLKVYKKYIDRYACSMEMQGASLSLMRLDPELKELLDAEAASPFLNL